MVLGLNNFKEWFQNYSDQYVIIGGTACELLMSEEGLDFRVTKDIDIVLVIESLTADFGHKFWEFIQMAKYDHINKSNGEPQFYRFSNPKTQEYPIMIELFSRRKDSISLPENAVLTPLPLDDELSSLSAILLDNDYYQFLLGGRKILDGLPLLDVGYLIPFKAKAWIDLSEAKMKGELIDSKNVRKHKNDVIRLSQLLTAESRIALPDKIYSDLTQFLTSMTSDSIDLLRLGIKRQNKEEVLAKIANVYFKS
jgi:hypothetical protein